MKNFKDLRLNIWNVPKQSVNIYWCGVAFLAGMLSALIGLLLVVWFVVPG